MINFSDKNNVFIKNLTKKKIFYIAGYVVAIIICTIICFCFNNNNSDEDYAVFETSEIKQNSVENEVLKNQIIYVHITGEVNAPGLIEVNDGARIKDVIDKAGGVTDLADIGRVNLAYQVKDGQKIIIPNVNESEEESISSNYIINNAGNSIIEGDNMKNNIININNATQSELELLTGVGPSLASKIIKYREENGKFKNIEDIKNVPGLGDAKFMAIKDCICVK